MEDRNQGFVTMNICGHEFTKRVDANGWANFCVSFEYGKPTVEEKTPVKPETLKDFVRRMRNMDIDWPENTIEKLNDIDERKDS